MKRKNKEKNKVIKGGDVGETQDFSVQKSEEMFNMISDYLYSSPIQAIIRELSCNAYDSHVENGNPDEPFEVKLPTKLDKEFYIRDYGVGLTPEEISELYTVVFKSDKLDTNNQIGCFGVGSKSPFAYKDQFTVTSITDGIERVYSVHYDEKNFPSITQMSEKETNKREGVKISFMVDRSDIHHFYKQAVRVFQFFDVRPNVSGQDVAYESPSKTGQRWSYYEGKDEMYAVMGNVAYKVDKSEIDNYVPGLALEFEIGHIDPSANRERLQYNDRVRNLIDGRADSFREEIHAEFEEAIDRVVDSESYIEAVEKAFADDDLKQKKRFYEDIVRHFPQTDASMEVKYNGRKLKRTHTFDNFKNTDKVKVYRSGEEKNEYDFSGWGSNSISVTLVEDKAKAYNEHDYQEVDVAFIYCDEKYCKWQKSRHYAQQNPDKYVFSLTCDESYFQEIVDHLGGEDVVDDVMRVSELEKPTKKKKEYKPTDKGEADFLKFSPVEYAPDAKNHRNFWETTSLPEEAYYVNVHRYKWGWWGSSTENSSPTSLNKLFAHLKQLGFDFEEKKPIIGLKNRFGDPPEEGWESLENLVNEMYAYFAEEMKQVIQLQQKCSRSLTKLHKMFGAYDYSFDDEEFEEMLDDYVEMFNESIPSKSCDAYNCIKWHATNTTQGGKIENKNKLVDRYNKILERYPLLEDKLRNSASYRIKPGKHAPQFEEYVNLVYNQKVKQ